MERGEERWSHQMSFKILVIKRSNHLIVAAFITQDDGGMLDSIEVCSFDHSVLGHILKNQTISDFQWSMEVVCSDNVPSQTSATPEVIPVRSPLKGRRTV